MVRPFAPVGILLLMAPALGSAEAPAPRPVDRAEIFGKAHVALRLPRLPQGLSETRGYDVEHYDLAIEVVGDSVAGTVTVEARAAGGSLDAVVLDLYDALSPGTVTSSHGVASTAQADDFLTVTLATPVPDGEGFTVTVPYDGTPPSVGGPITTDPFNEGSHGEASEGTLAPVIFTLSVPWRSGAWWPCKEDLSDRATIDLHVTVPDSLVAAANGVRASVEDLGDGRRTYHFTHGHPITPYLVMLAISDYVLLEDSVSLQLPGGGTTAIPLEWYVYPEEVTEAQADFARMDLAMQFLSDAFGPYPFADEKYAMAMVPWGGGMEHQTCVSLGDRFVRGDLFYEWVFVHELSHHWWGDHITLSDWKEVWLNEGFATYTEALWTEHITRETKGDAAARDAYAAYMGALDPFPPPDGFGLRGRIYDPAPLYGEAPYDKGAWVLHMLRGAVGDSLFFGTSATSSLPEELGVLRWYVRQYGGLPAPSTPRDPVTTEAFAQVVKDVLPDDHALGLDDAFVDSFFDQWTRRRERPSYRIAWSSGPAGAGHEVVVEVRQTHTHAEPYTMPIEIEVALEGQAPERVRVMNDRRTQSFTIPVSSSPTAVTLDPDRWILRNVPVETSVAEVAVPMVRVNPAQGGAAIAFFLTESADVSVRLYDAAGRAVRTLSSGSLPAASYELTWDGADDAGKALGSGVYFVELRAGSERRTTRLVFLR